MDIQSPLVTGTVAGALTYYIGMILTDLFGWEDKRAKKLILWLSLGVAVAAEAAQHWRVVQAGLAVLFAWIGAFAQSQGWFKGQQDRNKGSATSTEGVVPPAGAPTNEAPIVGANDQGGSHG